VSRYVGAGLFACGHWHLLGPPASLPAPGRRRSQVYRPVHERSGVYL